MNIIWNTSDHIIFIFISYDFHIFERLRIICTFPCILISYLFHIIFIFLIILPFGSTLGAVAVTIYVLPGPVHFTTRCVVDDPHMNPPLYYDHVPGFWLFCLLSGALRFRLVLFGWVLPLLRKDFPLKCGSGVWPASPSHRGGSYRVSAATGTPFGKYFVFCLFFVSASGDFWSPFEVPRLSNGGHFCSRFCSFWGWGCNVETMLPCRRQPNIERLEGSAAIPFWSPFCGSLLMVLSGHTFVVVACIWAPVLTPFWGPCNYSPGVESPFWLPWGPMVLLGGLVSAQRVTRVPKMMPLGPKKTPQMPPCVQNRVHHTHSAGRVQICLRNVRKKIAIVAPSV